MKPPTQTSAPLPDWAQEAENRQQQRRGAIMPPQQGGIPKTPATVSATPTMGGGKVREQGKVSTAGTKVQRPQTGTYTPPEPALTQSLAKLWRGLRLSLQKSRREREDFAGLTNRWQQSIPYETTGRFVVPYSLPEGGTTRGWRVGRFGEDGGLVMVLRRGHGLTGTIGKPAVPTSPERPEEWLPQFTIPNYGRGFRLSPEEMKQFRNDEGSIIAIPHTQDPSQIVRHIPHIERNDVHGLDIVHDPSSHWYVDWMSAHPTSPSSLLQGQTREQISGALKKLGARSISFEPLRRTVDRTGRPIAEGENNSYEQRKNLFQKFVDGYNKSTGGTMPADSFPTHPAYKLPSFITTSFDRTFEPTTKRRESSAVRP